MCSNPAPFTSLLFNASTDIITMQRGGLNAAKTHGRKPQQPYHNGPTLYFIVHLKSGGSQAVVSRYMVNYLHHPHMKTMEPPDEAEAARAIVCNWTTPSREQLLAVVAHLENFYQIVPCTGEIEQVLLDETPQQLITDQIVA
jgi:hypothetical protein